MQWYKTIRQNQSSFFMILLQMLMNVLKELMNAKNTATILWVATPANVLDQAIDFIAMAPLVKVSCIV